MGGLELYYNKGYIQMSDIKLYQGDCLELMNDIPDKSIDLILCDLPYASTKNKWDKPIDLPLLWGGMRG